MKKFYRSATCVVLAGLLFSSVYARSPAFGHESWRYLDLARTALDQGEYGVALKLTEQAREKRRQESKWNHSALVQAVRPQEVKRVGEEILRVRDVLVRRNDLSAVEIINDLILLKGGDATGISFFGNSISRMVDWLSQRSVFPDADMLSGQVYEAEGEYIQALRFYELAWQNRDFLDIPDTRYDLLYRMASVSGWAGREDSREKYLLLILADDSLFGQPGNEGPVLRSMLRTLDRETDTEKFFLLYRHTNYVALKALQDLTVFYGQTSRRYDRALSTAALAAVISITRIEEALKARDFRFRYNGLPDLMQRAAADREIMTWSRNHGAWDSLLQLARVLRERRSGNNLTVAIHLFQELADYCPDDQISQAARHELRMIQR